jgi:hypothetical protein
MGGLALGLFLACCSKKVRQTCDVLVCLPSKYSVLVVPFPSCKFAHHSLLD